MLFTFSFGFKACIVRSLGKSNVLADVMEALLVDGLVQRGFSPKVLAEAATAAELHDVEDADRVDLRDLYTFTVDPVMAQDFDDALSFERTPAGTTMVYVHIADVSYFVREGTALDKEALRRGNSVYVATGVEPMLPPQLSSGVCSLQAGRRPQGRHRGDGGGRRGRGAAQPLLPVAHPQRQRDWTTSSWSGCSRATRPWTPTWPGPCELGRTAGPDTAAGAARAGQPADRVHRAGVRVGRQGPVIVGADASEELESHWFIENYMVLANEQVASFLEQERVPTVYRVHDVPDPFNMEHLLDVLASLGLPTPAFNAMAAGPQEIRRVMRETAAWVDRFTPAGRGKRRWCSRCCAPRPGPSITR